MGKRVFIFCVFFVCSLAQSNCYRFSGFVTESQRGSLSLTLKDNMSQRLLFDDSSYNPHIPKGVLITGFAFSKDGAWYSNKFSIDIPSRSVAEVNPSNGLYLEKVKSKDLSSCLTRPQK